MNTTSNENFTNEVFVYEPSLGLEGNITELVDLANRYTNDYSDPALERISELAEMFKLEDKLIKIPLLLKDERKREYEEADGKTVIPYERMKIDYLNSQKISFSYSNYGKPGTELEIWNEDDKVLISICGISETNPWRASGWFSIKEFMEGDYNWLDNVIGQVLYYTKADEEMQ